VSISQQLGELFGERCYKARPNPGRDIVRVRRRLYGYQVFRFASAPCPQGKGKTCPATYVRVP
jgi:hypothetical protein